MDKLVESLRVLLENERDGVLHVDKDGCGRRNMQAVWKHCENILDEDGWSAEKKIDAVRKLLDEALEK